MKYLIGFLMRLFHATPLPITDLPEKPWRRPVFTYNMEPMPHNVIGNLTGTFCRYCGDWIEDSAYDREHRLWHRSKRGSWNYENPRHKRCNSDDITPDHEQWLEEIRNWARKNKEHITYYGSNTLSIGPGECQFNSEQEARDVLEPFGLEFKLNKCNSWGYITKIN